MVFLHFVLKSSRDSSLQHGPVLPLVQVLEEVLDGRQRAADFHVDVALVLVKFLRVVRNHVPIRERFPFVFHPEAKTATILWVLAAFGPPKIKKLKRQKYERKLLCGVAIGPGIVPFALLLRIVHAHGVAHVEMQVKNLKALNNKMVNFEKLENFNVKKVLEALLRKI